MTPYTPQNILVLFDEAAGDACVAIVGHNLDVHICSREEIERRWRRAGGRSILYRNALRDMRNTTTVARDLYRHSLMLNDVAEHSRENRASGFRGNIWPHDHAIKAIFPGFITREGTIHGGENYSIWGEVTEVPGRSFRIAILDIPRTSLLELSCNKGFGFHPHGIRAYMRLAKFEKEEVPLSVRQIPDPHIDEESALKMLVPPSTFRSRPNAQGASNRPAHLVAVPA